MEFRVSGVTAYEPSAYLVSQYRHRKQVTPLRWAVINMTEEEQKQRGVEARKRLTSIPKPKPLLAPIPEVKQPVEQLPAIIHFPQDKSRAIIAEIAQNRGVSVVNVIGPSRAHAICKIRDEVSFELRMRTRLSLAQIGRLMGKRDHSSVHWAIKRHAKRIGAELPEPEQIAEKKYTTDEVLSIVCLRWLNLGYARIAAMKGLTVNQVVGVVKRWNKQRGRTK
jgi:hypothetical protein